MRSSVRAGHVCAVAVATLIAGSTVVRADDAVSKRIETSASLALWIPQADADDYSDASLGVTAHGAYWITPMVAVVAAFDWVFVNEDETSSVTYWGLGLGARITTPRPAPIKPFGELRIGRYTLDSELVDSESGIGFQLGGGATMEISPSLLLTGQLAYSLVSIDVGFIDVDINALILSAGVDARF